MTAEVQNREHRDQVCLRREEHPVRKITHQSAPNFLFDNGKLKRILQDSGEDRIDLRLKAEAQARTLSLVSKRRLEDLDLGFRGDVEPPHSANGAEAGQQLLADLRPGAPGHPAMPVCRKALSNHLTMPVGNRDFFWMFSEVGPQRLNVFQLLVRRELVEARRRKRRLRHEASISSSGVSAHCLIRQYGGTHERSKRIAALNRPRALQAPDVVAFLNAIDATDREFLRKVLGEMSIAAAVSRRRSIPGPTITWSGTLNHSCAWCPRKCKVFCKKSIQP